MSPVWVVSMVLAWVVIALLCAVVLSLLRQLGELRARLAVLDPFAATSERVIEAPLHAPVDPFVADAGAEHEPGCLVVAVADAGTPPVPRIALRDLPPPLRPRSLPAVIGLGREGEVRTVGRAVAEADLRAAARACAGAARGRRASGAAAG